MTGDLDLLRTAALEAGRIALAHREAGLKIWSKVGGSPVTDADLAVDAYLKQTLLEARPDYGWLSEETADDSARLSKRRLFIVDPIDGTTAFMTAKPWWTVALAVVEDGFPIAAVVQAPARGETFEAEAGRGARLNGAPIQASDADSLEDASMLADAALFEHPIWTDPWPRMRVNKRSSIAYRMALVGAGFFDAALAPTPKWDWDVAAGCLIAQEGGARVSDHHGRPFRFNQSAVPQQPGLVCAAPGLQGLILRRCAHIGRAD